jgi:hypothetical protein
MTTFDTEALKAKHGNDLVCVESRKGPLVFRRPTRSEYDRWRDATRSDVADASKHARQLAKATLVHPDEAGFDAAIDDQPAMLCREVLDAIAELAGLTDARAPVKKL